MEKEHGSHAGLLGFWAYSFCLNRMRGKESKGYDDRLRVKGFALAYLLGILEVRGKWSNEYSLNHVWNPVSGTFPNSGACRF